MDSNRILISGGEGNLNNQLLKHKSNNILYIPSKAKMDIRNLANVYEAIKYFKPTHFIHTAAITRPMSMHETNHSLSVETNIIGTANCVVACSKHNVKLIYISTDYVYPGKDGNYKEDDCVLPFTNYGWSKLGGECSVQMMQDSLILRLAMCEKPFPHSKALVDMIKSPMYDEDVAKVIYKLINKSGIINVGGEAKSMFEFVKEDRPDIEKITLSEVGDVNMATNCSMNIDKLKEILK